MSLQLIYKIFFQFKPYNAEIISIKQDSYGIIVEELEKVLVERKMKMLSIPKVCYYYHYVI
jgi:DNA-binding transcriptional MocR family regulator